jgi:DNA-binding NarL/FixJ family response regulator
MYTVSELIRIILVDDHEIVREGLRTLLSEEEEFDIVGEAENGRQAIDVCAALQPDVVLMDLMMPEMNGIEAIPHVHRAAPNTQVLVLTSFIDDERVRSAVQAGAIGYVMKNVLKPDLLRAIRSAARGEPALNAEAQRILIRRSSEPESRPMHESLTQREMEVLRLLAQGNSNREIGAALHLTEGTVKVYVSTILDKLDVADRTQAALYAVRHHLVEGA